MSPSRRPARIFKPERLVMPIADAIELAAGDGELVGWLRDREDRGDPGPVFFDNGVVWTEASADELVAVMRFGRAAPRVIVAGNCVACNQPLHGGRVFFCVGCSEASARESERPGRPVSERAELACAAGGIRPKGGKVPPEASVPRSRSRHLFTLATGHLVQVRRPPEAMGYDEERHRWYAAPWEIVVWFPIYYGVGRDGSIPLRCGESFSGSSARQAIAKLREASAKFGPELGWAGVTIRTDGTLVMPEERLRAAPPRMPSYIGTTIRHLPTPDGEDDAGAWATPTDES